MDPLFGLASTIPATLGEARLGRIDFDQWLRRSPGKGLIPHRYAKERAP
jgi:hypothetical protein